MISKFFIDRPIFATVLAVLMIIGGLVALVGLPVEQYPQITPPTVQIVANYPGADAATLVETVTAPIEEQVNGVEGMIYLRSASTDTGQVTITVTFDIGTDADMAQVQVQNRVALAEPRLPEEVRRQGLSVKKVSTSLLMVVTLSSPEGEYDQSFLSNYASIYLRDELARVAGVGDVTIFGAKNFSMRLWLDPQALASRDLTVTDVLNAVRQQNVQAAPGRLGQPPVEGESGFTYTLLAQGRLKTVEQFEEIVLKVGADQRVVRLADVARVELGAEDYNTEARLNGRPTAAIGIYQLPGSNAVETADAVTATMQRLSNDFPTGLTWANTFDFTRFIRAAIHEVVVTLLVAALLVILVVYLFLQDLRATLIPAVTIPVSLIATFAAMQALGFSLNLLTLFGLVLAIGIVVDDAIVVVENVSRLMQEKGMSGKDAAKQSMMEITGPVIATTLVVLAVFIPAAMLGGMTGELYRQFAATIATATCFSTVNALTLSPALCALLLKPKELTRKGPFGWFNRLVDGTTHGYTWVVRKSVRASVVAGLLLVALTLAAGLGMKRMPTGFLPDEDMGYFFVNIQLPDAARLARSRQTLTQVEAMLMDTPGVASVIGINGYSLLTGANASNMATAIVVLEPWDERTDRERSLMGILSRVGPRMGSLPQAVAFPFAPPPISGLGAAGGFQYELQDRSDNGPIALQQAAMVLIGAAMQDPQLTGLFTAYTASVPQKFIDIDRTKALRMGVPLTEVYETLGTNLGGTYVNDFNLFGRVYRVYAQAQGEFRDNVQDLYDLKVRTASGGIAPLDTLLTVKDTVGPRLITRYNLFPSASINGGGAPGVSSGVAASAMERLSDATLPQGFGYAWTGTTYQEKKTGSQASIAFAMGLLVVFLVLCAQYESWSAPLAIVATVPLGVLGAVMGLAMRGYDVNVYAQIGFVLLIAMVAKNAILIVEFARELKMKQGKSAAEAAVEAARLRLRPILMTALSFVLGVLPLLIAVGAGAGSRRSLGTTVAAGTLFATFMGVLLVPALFVLIEWLFNRRNNKPAVQGGDQ